MNFRVSLKLVPTPWAQHIVSVPPVLIASTNTVDYICGDCGGVLMQRNRGRSTISSSIARNAACTMQPMHKTTNPGGTASRGKLFRRLDEADPVRTAHLVEDEWDAAEYHRADDHERHVKDG